MSTQKNNYTSVTVKYSSNAYDFWGEGTLIFNDDVLEFHGKSVAHIPTLRKRLLRLSSFLIFLLVAITLMVSLIFVVRSITAANSAHDLTKESSKLTAKHVLEIVNDNPEVQYNQNALFAVQLRYGFDWLVDNIGILFLVAIIWIVSVIIAYRISKSFINRFLYRYAITDNMNMKIEEICNISYFSGNSGQVQAKEPGGSYVGVNLNEVNFKKIVNYISKRNKEVNIVNSDKQGN